MSKLYPDTGNKLYLACCGCGQNPFELARRCGNHHHSGQYGAVRMISLLDGWLDTHAKCSGGPDKFKLAYHFAPNYDEALDADPVSNAVRLALVKS